ncbi:hypothetical protein ACFS6H_19900 [Terrimonas rubra]|uniref:Uncharacterized protein n=1 Tax=Terrimonas rubra TaxID=1035890 RepID=A0ABW6A9C3_9BACT
MNQASEKIMLLAKQLNLTPSETEEVEYILSKEEEEMCIQNAIDKEKQNMIWRMNEASANQFQIEMRIKNTNWDQLINRDEILKLANSSKLHLEWEKQQRLKEKEAEKELKAEISKRCDAKYFYKILKKGCQGIKNKPLIVSNETLPLIKALCFFFSEDERFESELGYNLQKGLLIRGISGLGKTFLIKLLLNNERKPVSQISMIEVSREIKDNGFYTPPENAILNIDDVGTEQTEVNYYGTKINWFKEFIESYHLQSKAFNRLIISTNNNSEQLEQMYGFRVRSRLKEMFNVIDVKGASMR